MPGAVDPTVDPSSHSMVVQWTLPTGCNSTTDVWYELHIKDTDEYCAEYVLYENEADCEQVNMVLL